MRRPLVPGASLIPSASPQATPPLERLTEGGLALDPLGLGVDVREADLDVLCPIRHQPPAHDVQAALAGLGIVAHDGQRIGRRAVPSRRKVRRWSMRWDQIRRA